MLDDYFHGSPDLSRPTSSKGQVNTSKSIAISKMKNKSEMQTVLAEEIEESERMFLERPKNPNFQPTHVPSMNWNESPEKTSYKQKAFGHKQSEPVIKF